MYWVLLIPTFEIQISVFNCNNLNLENKLE